MDKYDERRAALQGLRNTLGRGAIRQIAEAIGKDPSYVSRMLYPPTKPGYKRIGEDSVDALDGAFPGWLGTSASTAIIPATAPGPLEGYVRLEHLSARPSMGHGAVVDDPERIVEYLDVLERWVREKVGSTNPERIKILTGSGNSMQPSIRDGDLVFIDTSCHAIDTEGIYVLDVVGRLLLKKALILSDGTLILRSDNVAEYPNEERHDLRRAAETIVVCGRVLAWWTLRKG